MLVVRDELDEIIGNSISEWLKDVPEEVFRTDDNGDFHLILPSGKGVVYHVGEVVEQICVKLRDIFA